MAQRFVEEASAQLAPVYDQQVQTLQSQVPAIQQLYQSLMQGLEAQGKTQTQGILESSAARGLTRSSIPVDLQTTLAQTLMGEKSKLGAQQAQDIAGINMKVGDLGIQRAQAIQGLADSLYGRDMKEREFQMQQQAQEREFQMKQAAAAQSRKDTSGSNLAQYQQQMAQALATRTGGDGYVSPNSYAQSKQMWTSGGYGNAQQFDAMFAGFRNPKNKNYKLG